MGTGLAAAWGGHCGGGGSSGHRKKQKKGKKWVVQGEWEWDSSQEFIIERLIGKMIADGKTEVPGRSGVRAGTVLYRELWEGWPAEIATWEEEEDIPCGEVDFVTEYEAAQGSVVAGGVSVASDSESGDEL